MSKSPVGSSVPAKAGNLEKRMRVVERRTAAVGGLRYDFDNEGGWFFAAANDTTEAGGAPSAGYTDQAGNEYTAGFSWQFDTGSSDAPFAVTNDGGFLVDTSGDARVIGSSSVLVQSGGDITVAASGAIIVSSQIKSVVDPTLAQDAATKAYVDAAVGGTLDGGGA